MGELLKGKPVADAIAKEVKDRVQELKAKNIQPKLMIVRVGERPDDISYEKAAIKRMQGCGIDSQVVLLPADISQNDFIEKLKSVNNDESVHGILLFRPLPGQIDESIVKHIISPEKDIDCFNPANVAKIVEGDKTGFAPCTPRAAMEILKYYKVELKGKRAVVIGRSLVVGKPMAMLLLEEDATVTICHSKTPELSKLTSEADILVAAIGRARMIKDDFIKEGAVVIDVGINVDRDGNICGDVDTERCREKASLITPVPAGVGSVTTAVLAKHVLKACCLANNI
ncbi:MAG TPA: bifunctional 5,10-methylenetetrahydrofolate dehydrogenase/5,10-methenyltetrahydrofolate cyclohydrolase [Sedimentibacter sp.]|nr:bifunctional 5,10-methylenetetrahydrofolate dehydrogenase/5,10-methenyltetrahydrofolate cyclohydrolase [Sedimentibacter sp.]HHZ00271.1 bifunctional 5,10-methylenetetrahydrofolate dehydrogenase/5,10-methenyltetrahydrofolate cyclohydrolase [Tissierellia bacterium]HOK49157.1 bifunctional 5,10-methylenetetrahydrofolate dehydrogenase/5,10-methenyltetrahydrofolate cyclohydrolase [Sedimentibacter sp.]HOW23225.1 bifunctional 5,10-methylenetetrahydrofolate dehydrogenase/5,10-methenyltetrahydrofolate c